MASSTDNVKLGVCNVLFDGVDLGYTKGGVEVEVATTTHEVTVDQFGNTPVAELITGRTVSVTVPLAETTLDNLIAIMPGATLNTDGVRATGTVTFSTAAPVNNDKITIAGTEFTFKTAPNVSDPRQMPVPATINDAAEALAQAVNATGIAISATYAGAVVTLTADVRGTAGNVAVAKTVATAANVTVTNLTGGVDPTYAYVAVSSGINVNLLSVAKELVLRPVGTSGEEDFIVYRAACPGAMTFTYQHDAERIFSAAFKGYIREDGQLFAFGQMEQ